MGALRHLVRDRDRRRHRQPGPAAEEGRAGIVLRGAWLAEAQVPGSPRVVSERSKGHPWIVPGALLERPLPETICFWISFGLSKLFPGVSCEDFGELCKNRPRQVIPGNFLL